MNQSTNKYNNNKSINTIKSDSKYINIYNTGTQIYMEVSLWCTG